MATNKADRVAVFNGRDTDDLTNWMMYQDGEIRTYSPDKLDPRLEWGGKLKQITDPAELADIGKMLDVPVLVPVRVALEAFPELAPEDFADLA